MNFFESIVDIVSSLGGKLADNWKGDEKRAFELSMEALRVQASQMTAQTDINKVEAAHRSIFVAGWRPMIGWTCAFSLAFEFMLRPLIMWGLVIFMENPPILPALDMDVLLPLVFALLGVGGLRTIEKVKGVAK